MSTDRICHIYLYPFIEHIDKDTLSVLKERPSKSRLKRSEKFVNQKDRIKSILGDNLIRYSIYRSFKLKFSSMKFSQNYYGKPFLRGRDDIYFSLSYTDGWIGCAVSTEPVGFDLEKIKKIDLSIAKRFFTEGENHYISECRTDKKYDRFFEIWTLKEAFIKAIGKGLSCPLDTFSIVIKDERVSLETNDPTYPMMNFLRIHIADNYKCALCYSPGSHPDIPVLVSTPELLGGDTF